MKKHRSRDPLALDVARDLEKRGYRVNIERLEDTAARLRAAERDPAAWDAFVDESFKQIDQIEQSTLQVVRALRQADAAQFEDRRDQRKRLAAAMKRLVDARADALRGVVRNPVEQAWKEAAQRFRHPSGPAANRWWRRNH